MKLVIFLSVIISIVYCMDKEFFAKSAKRSAEVVKECLETTGANQDDLASTMELKIPSRKQARCVMACYNMKFGIQDADGKLNKTGAMEAMQDLKAADSELYEKGAKLFDMCIDQVESTDDVCDTAANFMYCFNINGAKMGLKPGMVPL